MILEILLAIFCPPIMYVIVTYIEHLVKLKNYPPGPFPLPIIGNLHQLGSKPYMKLGEFGKIYGSVMSLSFGMKRYVIVNTIEPAKEALVTKSNDFAGRPTDMYTAEIYSRGYKDVAFGDFTPTWLAARKIVHSSMKLYGEGMTKMKSLITEESSFLNERLIEKNGKPVVVHYELGLSVINVISAVVFGKRYDYKDSEFREIVDMAELMFTSMGTAATTDYIPWLKYFPSKSMDNLKAGIRRRDCLISAKVNEHIKSYDADNLNDFLDVLLKISSDETKDVSKLFTQDHLEMVIGDVFLASIEPTLSTLRWFTLCMLQWPEYQDKIYNEIINVVGNERYPDYEDRSSLHIFQAAITEAIRFAYVAPLGIVHKSTIQSTIAGQPIPKNTPLMFNIWYMHHDERHWDEPFAYRPERWLNENGEYTPKQNISYLPFSAGRRACPGELLGKLYIFTFLTRLIKDLKIEKVSESQVLNFDGNLGITFTPDNFSCIYTKRK